MLAMKKLVILRVVLRLSIYINLLISKAIYNITKTLYSILLNNMNFSADFWGINLVTFYNFDIKNQ